MSAAVNLFTLLLEAFINISVENYPHVRRLWNSSSFYIYCVHYLNNSSIVTWVIIYLIILVTVYLAYARLLQALLKRMELPELSRNHLVEASWYAGLSGASIPGCVAKLLPDVRLEGIEHTYNVLFDKMFKSEDVVQDHLKTLFVIFCALHAHSTSLALVKKGISMEFFSRLSFFLFFCSTYSLRCILLGMACTIIINTNVLCAEVTRIFCILNRKKAYQIFVGKYIAYLFFMLHCIIWSGTFLYLMPMKVVGSVIHMRVSPVKMPALLILNVSLWSFYWLQMFSCPLSKFVWNATWGWFYNMGQRDLLDCALFPPRNDVLCELRLIRNKIREQQNRAEEFERLNFSSYRETQSSDSNESSEKKALFQTVKCVMTLKRKLKRLREQKAAQKAREEEEASQLEWEEEAENEKNVEESVSDNDHWDHEESINPED